MTDLEQDAGFLCGLTILVVEDDADALEQLGDFLQRQVGTVVRAENAPEGIKRFHDHRPRIVLTDILMSGMDGLDLAEAIRKVDSRVPIIVFTAFERNDFLLRSIELGIDKYVLKPIDPDRLRKALLECAHQLRAEEQLARRRILDEEARRQEAINILAAGMAHDYNNLLNLILGWSKVAENLAEPGTEIREILGKTSSLSGEARELGRRLMFFAQGNDTPFVVAPIGKLIMETVSSRLLGSPFKAEFNLDEGLPHISHVESQLQWVFGQLTTNACQAMTTDGVLKVSARFPALPCDELPGVAADYVHISVQDTGPGIPAENLAKIFNPYFSTKEAFQERGLGLGLALCRKIIENHLGRITAESIPGLGGVFHVFLPIWRETGKSA